MVLIPSTNIASMGLEPNELLKAVIEIDTVGSGCHLYHGTLILGLVVEGGFEADIVSSDRMV
jgi:hypothetical protein